MTMIDVKSIILSLGLFSIICTGGWGAGIPGPGAWTEQGIILTPGSGWESFGKEGFGISGIVHTNGTFYLYYTGASGPRSNDGGAANRALGVATSTDGINFTRYSGNPILTHQPSGGHCNQQEEGIVGGAAVLDDNGDVVLFYGGLTATSCTGVKSQVRVARSSNRINFTDQGIVIPHTMDGGGNEVWPIGAVHDPGGAWHVWYTTDGFGGRVTSAASGPSSTNLTPNSKNPILGGARTTSAFLHSNGEITAILAIGKFPIFEIRTRKTSLADVSSYLPAVDYYTGTTSKYETSGHILAQAVNNKLYWYYSSGSGSSKPVRKWNIRLRTAPFTAGGTPPPPPPPPDTTPPGAPSGLSATAVP